MWVGVKRGQFLIHSFTHYPTGLEAEKDGVPVFKFSRWRAGGQAVPDVVAKYQALGAELFLFVCVAKYI